MKPASKLNRSVSVPPELTAYKRVVPSLRGHIEIARIGHWVKNVFVLPGIVVALSVEPSRLSLSLLVPVLLGFLSVCLVASSNYVVNELIDASSDLEHPSKYVRPVPSGCVNIPLAYVQWLLLMVAGVGLGFAVSIPFAATMLVLWIMGCIYNIPPIRSKDWPYVDVLSESINNPLRMLAGWFIVGTDAIAPLSLLLSYWMVGSYFMAIKRFAELRLIDSPVQAAAYRKSFGYYTEQRLLVSIMFYASAAMLFLGAFIMRYRLELILSFPLVALVMAIYLAVAFKDNSVAYAPERLVHERSLMAAVILCAVSMAVLLWADIPSMQQSFAPTMPIRH
jgi:decaprenyl-phosphate phosphoribosyltransferase